jgi:hydroxyacylglutathione hydrolase
MMLFERIESEGIAHYSYLIGDGHRAVVIDPRWDCDIYIDRAVRNGFHIFTILETHRNEDYLVGSVELAERTEAEIWHADGQLDYQYGQAVSDGQSWKVGRLKITAIHSPGHTPGSMSYLLHEPDGQPWILFTGDALFAGDVGRVDLLGMDRAEELAGQLYDTLFNKLLPLGDEIIVCPAHGSGSVCGSSITDRLWTTLGLERRLNPMLKLGGREEFIGKAAKELERPPYFRRMEKLNLEGPPLLGTLPESLPLSAGDFAEKAQTSIVVDTRMELGFSAAHVPQSLSIWLDGLASFVGWFVPYDKPLLLVNETDNPMTAVRRLIRLGYDQIAGHLTGGMLTWHSAGQESHSVRTITVQQLCGLLDEEEEIHILDVRSEAELASNGAITGAQHIHITQLPQHLGEIPKGGPVYIFCGSGLRSMIAASLLQRQGWQNVTVVLGGMAGWSSVSCPLK